MYDLKALRLELRAQRCTLDAREHAQWSARAMEHLQRHRLFHAARNIACYLPNDGEVDLSALIVRCWELGKTVYLPVLSRLHHNRLHFLPYRAGDELVENRFHIPEPKLHPRQVANIRQLDLVLMPLVGFDARGNRLGMGGGFYDRTFACLRRRQYWRKPHLLGVAFEFQQVEKLGMTSLPHRQWDIPLHGVVTEEAVKLFDASPIRS